MFDRKPADNSTRRGMLLALVLLLRSILFYGSPLQGIGEARLQKKKFLILNTSQDWFQKHRDASGSPAKGYRIQS